MLLTSFSVAIVSTHVSSQVHAILTVRRVFTSGLRYTYEHDFFTGHFVCWAQDKQDVLYSIASMLHGASGMDGLLSVLVTLQMFDNLKLVACKLQGGAAIAGPACMHTTWGLPVAVHGLL